MRDFPLSISQLFQLTIAVFYFSFTHLDSHAQNNTSCTSPLPYTLGSSCNLSSLSFDANELELWFEFSATAPNVLFSFEAANNGPHANLSEAMLFENGNCSSPIVQTNLSGDTLSVRATGLITGDSYKLLVRRSPGNGNGNVPAASAQICGIGSNMGSAPPPTGSDCLECVENLVTNGDFEEGLAGLPGINSSMNWFSWTWSTGSYGRFSIMDQLMVSYFNGYAWQCSHRTPNGSYFFVADIGDGYGLGNYLWAQNITGLTPSTTYYFSCWVNNLCRPTYCYISPSIILAANGVPVAGRNVTAMPDTWVYICGEFTTAASGPQSTSANIAIYPGVAGHERYGGDIAIDDIRFGTTPLTPNIFQSDTSICKGNCVTFSTDYLSDNYTWIIDYQIGFDNDQIINTTNGELVFCPTVEGDYTVSLSIICGETGGNEFIELVSDPLSLEVTAFSDEAGILTGSNQMCCSDQTYSVEDIPGASYQWTVTEGVVVSGQGTSSIIIDWSTATSSNGSVVVAITNTEGCQSVLSMPIGECCEQPGGLFSPVFYSTNSCETSYASDLVAYNGGPVVAQANQSIIINGTFIVDVPLYFVDVDEFYLGAEAKFLIEPGSSLSFNQCDLKSSCNYMWDGIYISDQTASLSMINCSIRDGYNAIVSQSGGSYSITGNVFTENRMALHVKSHTGLLNGVFSNNSISSTYGGLIAPLAYPDRRAEYGVKVNGNSGVTIAGGNSFNNLDFGIHSTNSNLNVRGNTFINIDEPMHPTGPPAGTAIYTSANGTAAAQTTVGGSNNDGNSFTNCHFGVITEGDVNGTITHNAFQDLDFLGVSCRNNQDGFHVITDNTFTNPGRNAINTFNNINSAISVLDNDITFSTNPSPGVFKIGISVSNIFPQMGGPAALVNDNFVREAETGIRIVNMPQAEVNDNNIRWHLTNNAIAAEPEPFTGIYVAHSQATEVDDNNISRFNGTPNGQYLERLVGIDCENSMNIRITNNVNSKVSRGIRMEGANAGSTISCNTASQNWTGIHFENGDIGDQGNPTMPSDNKWTNNLGYFRMTGNLDFGIMVEWHHRNGNAFNPNPMDPALINDILLVPGASGQSDCGGIIIGQGPKREKAFGKIVRDEKTFSNYPDAHHQLDKTGTFIALESDPSLLYLGLSDDQDYLNFYNDLPNTNNGIASICELFTYIQNNDLPSAQALNSSFQPNNTHESNWQKVSDVYFNFISAGTPLDIIKQSELENIACQDGLLGGGAVYAAREILGPDNPSCGAHKHLTINEGKETIKESYLQPILLYPNPSNGQLFLKSSLQKDAIFQLIDLHGRIVYTQNLPASVSEIVIKPIRISTGIYSYRILNDHDIIHIGKVSIYK